MKLQLSITICLAFANLQAQTDGSEAIIFQKEAAPIITAAFTVNKTTICVGETIQFTDVSTGSPSTWAWQFVGGSPASSTSQNPMIQYNTPGTYNVVLTASNGNDQNTAGKLALIRVEECTGTNFNSVDSEVLIFPVPAKNQLYISASVGTSFIIYSLSGQILYTDAVAANQTVEVNIHHLAKGMYFIQTNEGGSIRISKIIVE